MTRIVKPTIDKLHVFIENVWILIFFQFQFPHLQIFSKIFKLFTSLRLRLRFFIHQLNGIRYNYNFLTYFKIVVWKQYMCIYIYK